MSKLENVLKNQKVRDFTLTLGANAVGVLTGIISTFLIPKYLELHQYAYFRLFTFYIAYVGLFHFGFNDGIYVRYGSYDYEELPKKKFRGYFYFLVIFQLVIFILFTVLSNGYIKDENRRFVFIFVFMNLFLINITSFFTAIYQFTRNFKAYSLNIMLSKVLYIIFVTVLLVAGFNNYVYLIALQTLINFLILLIYIWKSRDLVLGAKESIQDNLSDINKNFSVGFFVLIGNLMGIIIIGIDRFVIDRFFSVKDFALYSFAVSLLSLFYILLGAITTVTYPYLARLDKDNMGMIYERMKVIMFVTLGFSLSGFFIVKYITLNFIPNYASALDITLILFPTILFSGQTTIVSANFYKVLKLQKEYTINNLVALLIALFFNTAAYFIFKTLTSIAIACFISFYLWMVYSDSFFKKKIGANLNRLYLAEFIIITIFLVLGFYLRWYLAFIIYISMFLIIITIFFKRDIKEILKSVH